MNLDSYLNTGVLTAMGLVNALTPGFVGGKPMAKTDPVAAIESVLALDPPSLAALTARDGPGFVALARDLRAVFEDLERGDTDAAAHHLNLLLGRHPANPHLAKEDGVWRLHHHPTDIALLPMWTSICAEGLARMIGEGGSHRLGRCSAANCDRVYVDATRNASRRFCSTACQNRTKTAKFRRRRIAHDG